ncbi:ComF family protein [Anaerosalibacter massiliensis]|uniref:ComF family protein n=1 Tax=Anaerosalibacter massiliensis TaxID=1347392 RepID=UPI0005B2D33C|nr:phosphoribosyltransferase family protein [Anaerosalibacter massiliensis]
MNFFKGINELLFPEEGVCLLCNVETDDVDRYICSYCRNNIEYLNREIDLSYLEKTIYSLFYNEFIKEKIYLYKYENYGYLYKPLGEILLQTIYGKNIMKDIDIITYVPIHRRRKAIRGYNQSELIAGYLSKKLDIPISKNNLIRIKWTKPQNKLNRHDRIRNIEGVFKIKDSIEFMDKEILIIDDIITTGSTVSECAKVLLQEGKGRKVYALSITSGMKL